MATAAGSVSADQRDALATAGYVLLQDVAAPEVCAAMLTRAVEIGRRSTDLARGPQAPPDARPQLHRDTVFADFAHDPAVLDLVGDVLGTAIEVCLSEFIVKGPGAYGQPWHQDAYDFPVEPDHRVGVRLAVTEATLDNGCLWALPGSHTEPVHEHLPDRRPDSRNGYVEIVDHDMDAAVPVLMEPGDVLLFDSHLMHRSTDNHSNGIRAAMVYHYRPAGTTG
jgi:phytanoyl-CoA hydroxylase